MFLHHKRYTGAAPARWLLMLSLALSSGGILLGLHADDYHLVNRSAAVLLLAIALACVQDILA